jgi:hypothetical protein
VEEALKDSLDRMRLAWRSSQNVVAFGLPGLVACFLMTLVS